MHSTPTHLTFSATDLAQFLACLHLTLLERARARGGPKPPYYDDPGIDVLRHRGQEHEQLYLSHYRAAGKSIAEPTTGDPSLPPDQRWARAAAATADAMRAGADVVYQGTLYDGTWVGRPDFLVRVDRPSSLGSWSYTVVDAKLAREAKWSGSQVRCASSGPMRAPG
jgi:predicted RecB family nuclease